jgi:tRNA (uracil-5-)-methyltransferase TRM9
VSPETIERLAALNRSFYREHGPAFSAARRAPWPGWLRVLDRALSRAPEPEITVLDAGCGNGRFALALDERLSAAGRRARYVGVDASEAMIADARRRLSMPGALCSSSVDLVLGDLFELELDPEERFDLIALFGVLHHVPSRRLRRALIESMTAKLSPGGLLAATIWRFGAQERFAAKVAAWSLVQIDEHELEPGDYLLRFGDEGALRYCHFIDDAEAAELFRGIGEIAETFEADGASGDLNRYVLLEAAAR